MVVRESYKFSNIVLAYRKKIICLYNGSLVVILIQSLALSESLMILWMFSIFLPVDLDNLPLASKYQ